MFNHLNLVHGFAQPTAKLPTILKYEVVLVENTPAANETRPSVFVALSFSKTAPSFHHCGVIIIKEKTISV
jgi:hypothetical protein